MRDYYKNSLKYGEDIPKEELFDLYINQNYSRAQLIQYFNVCKYKLSITLKKYGFNKNKKRINKPKTKNIYFKTEDFKNKSKKTCIEKYNCEYPTQYLLFKEKRKRINDERFKVLRNITIKENIKEKTLNWLKELNIEIKEVKDIKLKRKRNNIIEEEKYIREKLQDKFGSVLFNHVDNKYPFHCDFYIPNHDIYIEYQGFEGHNDHPFNYNNPNDVQILLKWAELADLKKIDKRNKYLAYIATWVEKDPLKRKVAKINNLNWFEFFNLEQFNEWYNSI
jgi:hypothetical protein